MSEPDRHVFVENESSEIHIFVEVHFVPIPHHFGAAHWSVLDVAV